MKNGKKYRYIEVKGVDSFGFGSGWDSIDTHKKAQPSTCYSVGFELTRTKKHITVASTISKHANAGGVVTIPMGAIRKIKRMKTI